MPEYGALFTFDIFHQTKILFVSLVAYFYRLLESFPQKIGDASGVPYIAFLDSSYIYFLMHYLDIWNPCGSTSQYPTV